MQRLTIHEQPARRFWMTMAYACSGCGREVKFFLEEGCEGPKDVMRPVPPTLLRQWKRTGCAPPETIPYTANGRRVVPVPFVAAGCERCQGPPPWRPGGAVLQHVSWNEDEILDPPVSELPRAARFFRYPSRNEIRSDPIHACGVPEIAGVNRG